jgi:hypothetical protein
MKQTMHDACFPQQSLPYFHNLATVVILDADLLEHHAATSHLLDVEAFSLVAHNSYVAHNMLL